MLELLAFVILVAIFFGISVSAALNGVIIIFVAIIVIWLLIAALFPPIVDAFEWNQERKKKQEIINQEKRKAAQAKRDAKKATKQGKYPWTSTIIGFVLTYVITLLLIVIIGLYEKAQMPIWLLVIIPSTPFVTLEIVAFIKKRARR